MSDIRQVATQRTSLVAKFADKYGVDANKMLDTLKSTAFRQKEDVEITNEQMMALLIVADQYNLNPFTKEIYAYPDKGGIVPVVGVDGWARIVNEHPQCDGFEFNQAEERTMPEGGKVECPEWMECVLYRKDRSRPAVIREYLDEVYRKPFKGNGKNGSYTIDGPWQTHTKRFLRHKAFVQGARLVFGFAGIYDEDEAQRILERDMGPVEVANPVPQPQSRSARATAPAITQADADGVIKMPTMQRQAESVQQDEPAAQRAPRRAAAQAAQQQQPAVREPGADDEPFEQGTPPAGTPASESVMRILKTKMEQAALGEADLRKRFGFGYDGVTMANYNEIVAWIEDPMPGA